MRMTEGAVASVVLIKFYTMVSVRTALQTLLRATINARVTQDMSQTVREPHVSQVQVVVGRALALPDRQRIPLATASRTLRCARTDILNIARLAGDHAVGVHIMWIQVQNLAQMPQRLQT